MLQHTDVINLGRITKIIAELSGKKVSATIQLGSNGPHPPTLNERFIIDPNIFPPQTDGEVEQNIPDESYLLEHLNIERDNTAITRDTYLQMQSSDLE